jgi:hypothetical protein
MDTFINEDAKLAVKRGINWLDENHPKWVSRIDLTKLDMSECSDCVIGQAVGDYSLVTRNVVGAPTTEMYGSSAVWAVQHGFESPGIIVYQELTGDRSASYGYRELDTLWSEEVRKRLA